MREVEAWPEALRARARVLVDAPARDGVVLYWMRVAARDHENPALDAALETANALGTTALVYHAVSERYPYASDRHHTFILEGARDVARGLRRRGVAYALHVEREGARGPALRDLAERAALVITEDAPFPPLAGWTRRLAAHLADRRVPFVAVDASCVVPMPLVGRRYDRAYALRTAAKRLAAAALARPWRDVAPARPPAAVDLPFAPVDAEALDDRAIARLVAACAIDHGVGPVRATRGGSVAGYARWEAFRAEGLARYAARRNDASIDGTSRLSPWLHYGHVAPLRIARDAATLPQGAGTDKFLDELLTWREVAWHYAAHTPDLETLDALPGWARETLAAHAGDPRVVLSRERLERGRTGDPLWDLAQRSLVVHGELHNNVRMTWGKAIPGWTRDPEDARRALVELNHRYALDGRDPASYGGLYWCLGLFDRPFAPPRPVLGAVRPRPTEDHARRLDLAAYAARVGRPDRAVGRVAVIGAGLAGLACARTLRDHGVDVVVFDQGRSPGGRLAGHPPAGGEAVLAADLGAAYFTARDERFARWVRSWLDEGVAARWHGRVRALAGPGAPLVDTAPAERYVGTPAMGALARHLARDLAVRVGHRVDELERRGRRYRLAGAVGAPGATLGPRDPARDAAGGPAPVALGEFDVVLACVPPALAAPLLCGASPHLAAAADAVPVEPCLALAFAPEDGAAADALRALPFDGLFVGRDRGGGAGGDGVGDGGPVDAAGARALAWVAREASKPGRPPTDAWTLHAAPGWSRDHLRAPREAVEAALLAALAAALGLPPLAARASTLRRWAHARPASTGEAAPLFDDDARIGAGGDWSLGGRVEAAFLAGVALAGRVLGLPHDEPERPARPHRPDGADAP